MSCLCWNVWEMRNPSTFRALKALLQANSPNLVFLSETRLAINKVDDIRKKLKFSGVFVVDRIGQGGGLMLLWDDSMSVSILSSSSGHIDVVIESDCFSEWRFTGFYENPDASLHHHSWELLKCLRDVNSLSWLVGGDFNEIRFLSKKKGGRNKAI